MRNSVGHAWNPANGQLWFTDNQVDGMGDDIPPGELNRATGPGQHFGFPWALKMPPRYFSGNCLPE